MRRERREERGELGTGYVSLSFAGITFLIVFEIFFFDFLIFFDFFDFFSGPFFLITDADFQSSGIIFEYQVLYRIGFFTIGTFGVNASKICVKRFSLEEFCENVTIWSCGLSPVVFADLAKRSQPFKNRNLCCKNGPTLSKQKHNMQR